MGKEKNYNRYQRQILLKEFGTGGQDKLLSAKVLVVGAGGLGCPALQYLAAAGVGEIGIVDFDVVSLSNLQRQILYTTDDLGKGKAEIAANKIKALNPEIKVDFFNEKVQNNNAWELISAYDIVLDGSDNFATRYLLNDACVLLDKTLVYGAVLKFEGQVGVFNSMDRKTGIKVNYRDLFPVPPKDALSCNDVGVLGVLPGIIGTLQAAEVIKLITSIGTPLLNQFMTYNALNNSFYTFEITKQKDADMQMPLSKEEFLNFNYEWFCNPVVEDEELDVRQMEALCKTRKAWLVDVREMEETPVIYREDCVRMPLSTFEESMNSLPLDYQMVFICKTGKRSMVALHLFKKRFPDAMAFSLKGGLDAWPQAVTK